MLCEKGKLTTRIKNAKRSLNLTIFEQKIPLGGWKGYVIDE